VTAEQRSAFECDGFVVVPDLLSPEAFEQFRAAVLDGEYFCREQLQGDTITRRVAIGPEVLRSIPQLDALLNDRRWKGLMAYVASTRSSPLYYIQAIFGGVAEGPRDPQLELHSDTFHPSLKAWLFLTDVEEDGRPLTYVAGSHRLTAERIAWEQRKSEEVLQSADRLSQRGSFRVSESELPALGLPAATHFVVRANTLVVADTCGFHARADSTHPTVRVEIWAYARRTPFLPWTGLDLLSWAPIAWRRAEWLGSILDAFDRRGWMKQHWRPVGRRRILER
jgi:hypothetical protein